MKKLTTGLLVISLFLTMTACSRPDASLIPIKANTPFKLPVGKTARLENEDLSLQFIAVTADSRCPTGVECIWAGEAKCQLRITQKGNSQETVLTQSGSSASAVESLVPNYRMSFQLYPYPRAGEQIKSGDYFLSMTLTK
jgi:hypothetical protein